MEKRAFKAMSIGDWFHSKKMTLSYLILDKDAFNERFWCHVYNLKGELIDKMYWSWALCEDYDFEFFSHPNGSWHDFTDKHEPTPEQPQQMTVAEALKLGLKVGDDVWIKFKVVLIDEGDSAVKARDARGACYYSGKTEKIIYTPEAPYTPKHREFCAVTTKSGLTTECEVYECKGELYAIPLKDGKPAGVFSPEQIERFLPLTKNG